MTTGSAISTFLRSGELGPIAIGTTKETVNTILGPPDHSSGGRFPFRFQIWKYGDLELTFRFDTVFMICLDTTHDLDLSQHVVDEPGRELLLRNRTFEAFQRLLRQLDISFQVDPNLTSGSQRCLTLGVGIRAVFDAAGILESLQLAKSGVDNLSLAKT